MHDIGNGKYVCVSEWNGKMKVHIRQYFDTAQDPRHQGPSKMVPTRKGIALNLYEWEQLKKVIDAVDQELSNVEMTDDGARQAAYDPAAAQQSQAAQQQKHAGHTPYYYY